MYWKESSNRQLTSIHYLYDLLLSVGKLPLLPHNVSLNAVKLTRIRWKKMSAFDSDVSYKLEFSDTGTPVNDLN